jgi:ABC-type Co2+ transport system permease subunit
MIFYSEKVRTVAKIVCSLLAIQAVFFFISGVISMTTNEGESVWLWFGAVAAGLLAYVALVLINAFANITENQERDLHAKIFAERSSTLTPKSEDKKD